MTPRSGTCRRATPRRTARSAALRYYGPRSARSGWLVSSATRKSGARAPRDRRVHARARALRRAAAAAPAAPAAGAPAAGALAARARARAARGPSAAAARRRPTTCARAHRARARARRGGRRPRATVPRRGRRARAPRARAGGRAPRRGGRARAAAARPRAEAIDAPCARRRRARALAAAAARRRARARKPPRPPAGAAAAAGDLSAAEKEVLRRSCSSTAVHPPWLDGDEARETFAYPAGRPFEDPDACSRSRPRSARTLRAGRGRASCTAAMRAARAPARVLDAGADASGVELVTDCSFISSLASRPRSSGAGGAGSSGVLHPRDPATGLPTYNRRASIHTPRERGPRG